MTHEELLAKIDNVGHAVEYGHGIETSRIVKQLSALRAVVELHKPGRTAMVTGEIVCDGCDAGDNYYSNMWPCQTIQAIEGQLK